ncbi:zinc-dependent peptidase [Roseimaritima sediminicola]|uniref:zinc-dependent peptidase n=1 Tax=Roseimaritima sediminicola TaxID=2662066 RepID=UPI0012983F12|nr:zinc-dependent peptidase [Roseimaritima sediminicola]
MLVTPESNRSNQILAATVAAIVLLVGGALAFVWAPWWLLLAATAPLVYYLLRRRTLRRKQVLASRFPEVWEAALVSQVDYFRVLDEPRRERFRNLVKVFLDEVTITGIGTEVEESTRVLVAASAVIPIMGFEDWEYAGLGEVLIYPSSFSEDYQTDNVENANTLGMVGVGHLSGVMILSKPSLLAGFRNQTDKRNVGIHEFAHLVDKADGDVDGIPPGLDQAAYQPWVRWVGEELKREVRQGEHIDDYAYTNEAEYFAVLSEYFFEAPALLEQKNPELYAMLQRIYHQNPKRIFGKRRRRRRRVGRNSPCPCGSGEKYKRCCRRKAMRGMPVAKAA